MFVKPEQMSWSIHRYDDVTKSLVLSDLEKLKGETLEEAASGNNFCRSGHHEVFWDFLSLTLKFHIVNNNCNVICNII